MTRISLVCVGAALLLGACIGVPGNGRAVREARRHEDFTRVDNDSSLDVQIRKEDHFSVIVRIDSNLVDLVDTFVDGDTLRIELDEPVHDPIAGPHVIIAAPFIDLARLDGSGSVSVEGFEDQERMRLELDGSGDLTFAGSADRVEAWLDGSGVMELSGATGFADLELLGSGDLRARSLAAAGGNVRVSGSGTLTATIDGDADAEIDGSGDIELYGDVSLGRSRERGSGDIRVH